MSDAVPRPTSTSGARQPGPGVADGPGRRTGSVAPHRPVTPAAPDPRLAVARLVAVVVAVVVAGVVTHTAAVLIVVAALVAMIMLHELGHLLTAKWGHMLVTEYFLGFGPRLWSVRRGETEYGIKAIPAGGYVKIVGMTSAEDVDPADEARTYRQAPFRNRLLVAVAGSAMHGVMALVLLWGLAVFVGVPRTDAVAVTGYSPVTHSADPARAAGIEPGDIVVQVGATVVRSPQDLQRVVAHSAGRALPVVVERHGQRRTLVVTPQSDPAVTGANGRIGVVIANPVETTNPAVGVVRAGQMLGRVVTATFAGIGQTFSASGISNYFHDLTNAHAAAQAANGSHPRVSSIYGAARIAVQGAHAGASTLITILVLIIVSVGILNLFPMLPLDGGHVLIAVYERVRSRRGRMYHADVNKLAPIAYGFVALLGFMVVSSLYLDITHPIQTHFQ